MSKKDLYEFITGIVTIVFKLFSKLRCACCNSTCVVDKSVEINIEEEKEIEDEMDDISIKSR